MALLNKREQKSHKAPSHHYSLHQTSCISSAISSCNSHLRGAFCTSFLAQNLIPDTYKLHFGGNYILELYVQYEISNKVLNRYWIKIVYVLCRVLGLSSGLHVIHTEIVGLMSKSNKKCHTCLVFCLIVIA